MAGAGGVGLIGREGMPWMSPIWPLLYLVRTGVKTPKGPRGAFRTKEHCGPKRPGEKEGTAKARTRLYIWGNLAPMMETTLMTSSWTRKKYRGVRLPARPPIGGGPARLSQ